MAEAIDGYVQTAENVTYYVSSGDIVSLAGETVLPGSQVWLYTFESPSDVVGYAEDKHIAPLTVPYACAQKLTQGDDSSTEADKLVLKFRRDADTKEKSLTPEVFGSYWFHYEDESYEKWRSITKSVAADVLAIRGTTEHARKCVKSLAAAEIGVFEALICRNAMELPNALNFRWNLFKARNDVLTLANGWRMMEINDDSTLANGVLKTGEAVLIAPDGRFWPATLSYKDHSLESVKTFWDETKDAKPLGAVDSVFASYCLAKADLTFSPTPVDAHAENVDYSLEGTGKILYRYAPAFASNEELATIQGKIRVDSDGMKATDATLWCGEMGGQFSAIGKTKEFTFVKGWGADANVPFGGAYGVFDELTIATDYGSREENVDSFTLKNATVVWDKRSRVAGFRECVTITGDLTIGQRKLYVEARYFGRDDWRVTIDAGLGGKAVLTPENPNFTSLEPLTLKELGEIRARNAATAPSANAAAMNGLGASETFEAPTAALLLEWTNAVDEPGLRFESPDGVVYSEAEMVELGYLQRFRSADESVARSYLTFLDVEEFDGWRATSDATLTGGTATLYETTATTRKAEAKAVDATFDDENGVVLAVVELVDANVDRTGETLELVWRNVLDGGETTVVATTSVALEDGEVDDFGRLTFVLNVAELGLPSGDYRVAASIGSTFATAESASFAFESVARIQASETALDFGSVEVDAANGGDSEEDGNVGVVERTIALENNGSKTAAFGVKTVGTAGTSDFYVVGYYADGESVDCENVVLRPGESVELTFYFAPSAVVGREVAVEFVETATGDVLSTLRLSGLGVSQTVPTAAITSDVVRVQEGCAVWLSGAASTAPNGGSLQYRWDLNGSSAPTGSALNDGTAGFYRVVETSDSFDARLQVVDENGVESEIALREIAVETVAPTLGVKAETVRLDGANVLTRFDLTASFFSARTVERWAANWGDGTETVLDERGSAATFARCYQAENVAKTYVATLKITASNGEVYEFCLGETLVPANERAEETPSLEERTNAFDEPQPQETQGVNAETVSLAAASSQTAGSIAAANEISRVLRLNGGTAAASIGTSVGGNAEENAGRDGEEPTSTSVWDDDEFTTDCGSDVWNEIEATLFDVEASRKKERRDLFEALAEPDALDVEGDGFDVWN